MSWRTTNHRGMKFQGSKLVLLGGVLGLALTSSACRTIGADYARPELALPPAYSQVEGDLSQTAPLPDAWWRLYGDPNLDALIDEAFQNNQDLAVAVARIDEARALLGLAEANRKPRIDASGSAASIERTREALEVPPGFPVDVDRGQFDVAIGASYEFDLWGRYARASEAARADLLATVEGQHAVRLTLAAEIALAYTDLLVADRQLAIANDTAATRRESVGLQQIRLDAGTISELDLAQAQAELAATEAAIPAIERFRRQTENRLGVLLGRFGGTIERRALDGFELPQVPAGLPSELLARRPDVKIAEARLIAANARLGLAKTELFPRLSLTASGGLQSTELAKLFSNPAGIWQLALGILQPLFDAGRNRRGIEAASAREKQALAQYLGSVQSAFADVENALVARASGAVERTALERQVEALARARKLALLRYEAGDSSYLEVLDSERALFRAQLEWLRSRRDELAASIGMFRALGGGWANLPPSTPPVAETQ